MGWRRSLRLLHHLSRGPLTPISTAHNCQITSRVSPAPIEPPSNAEILFVLRHYVTILSTSLRTATPLRWMLLAAHGAWRNIFRILLVPNAIFMATKLQLYLDLLDFPGLLQLPGANGLCFMSLKNITSGTKGTKRKEKARALSAKFCVFSL